MIGKTQLKSLLRRFAVSLWKRKHPDYLVILNYHQVTQQFDPMIHLPGTWTSTSRFESELSYLNEQYKVYPLEDALRRLNCGELRGACAALTFDDGDISIEQHAMPLLNRYKTPATFFINSAYLLGDGHFWVSILHALHAWHEIAGRTADISNVRGRIDRLRHTSDPTQYQALREEAERCAERATLPSRKCVSNNWLASLDGDQFTLGAHGHEHERYSMMSDCWKREDLNRNLNFMRQFRAFRPWFAVPFGRPSDIDDQALRIAKEAKLTVLAANGGVNICNAPVIQRIPADSRSVRDIVTHAMIGW